MEAQVIHWNSRYGSLEKCYDKDDGIAIISYFFLVLFFASYEIFHKFVILTIDQVSGCPGVADNPEFTKITDSLLKIKAVGRSVNISPGILDKSFFFNLFFNLLVTKLLHYYIQIV